MERKVFYEFGPFCLDAEQRVLTRGDERVDLTPKAFNMLLLLVQNSGRLVAKKDLLRIVWPDSHVEEANLAVTVGMLRKALRNGDGDSDYIETVPREGYRFTAEVVQRPDSTNNGGPLLAPTGDSHHPLADAASNQAVNFSSRYRIWLLIVGAAALIAILLDATWLRPQGAQLLRDVAAIFAAASAFYFYARSGRSGKPHLAGSQAAAFRGLLPFEPSDVDRFYGRDIEAAAITDIVTHSEFRFGVLYGDSGCGKTSLVRAGLLSRIEARGYLAILCRSYKNPREMLVEECRRRTGHAPSEGESAIDYLGRVARKAGLGLVLVCDQFEEFYINFATEGEQKPFVEFVAACYQATNLPVKFLFAIRSDFLHRILSSFDELIPGALVAARRYHLRHFDEDQAVEVIERSVQRANWPFEPGLSRKVASDLAVHGTVLPSELQMVGEQLQNRRIFTLEQYRRAGGKEQLVHSYLEDVIQHAGDQETAQLVLRCLISDDDTRLTLPLVEINRRVQRSQRAITRTLNLFVERRLIREIQDEEPWRYELLHEYLIEKINQATGKIMDATQRANRYFRQYLSSYAVDKHTRIPLTRLWFIHRYSDVERDERQRELLKKSRWRALWHVGASSVLLAFLVVGTAAWLSVTEEWEGVRLVDGHTAAVHRVVFSPDGHLLVSCGEDGTAIVWDFARRLKLAVLRDHTGWVNVLAFSPDGKWFATGGYDHKVIVWDAKTYQKVTIITGHNEVIGGLAFSPDGSFLASSGLAQTVLWDTRRWEKAYELPEGTGPYSAILFSADSRSLILSPYLNGWDLLRRQRLPSFNIDWGGVWGAVSPDGKSIVTVGADGYVRFVDRNDRRLLAAYKAHQDNGRAVAFSPDGRMVATGAENIVLWDTVTRKKIIRLDYPSIIWSLVFSPDGRWLVSSHGDGSILVWDPAEHELIANLNEHSGAVRSVAYSGDGKHIASAGEDDSIIIWDAERRQKQSVLIGHKNKVTGVAFSPDGKSFSSVDQDGVTIYWDLEQRDPRWSTSPFGSIEAVAASPDGHWIAASTGVYSSKDGRETVHFKNYAAIWATAFSPDGRWLMYPEFQDFAVWDTQSWKVNTIQVPNWSGAIALRFSPDGKFFVTGEDQGTVRLWQTNPLRQVALLGRHAARVKSVAFSPDGTQVASSGDDQVINLWDVKRRRLLTKIGTHAVPVLSVAFSPDGKHLVSGEHDKSVRLYTRHRSLWGHQLD